MVDLDAEQFVFKIVVEVESVSVFHIFPSRVLVEDAGFPTSQGLQSAPELSFLCVGQQRMKQQTLWTQLDSWTTCLMKSETYSSGGPDLLHAEFFSLVKHEQHQRLEQ